MQGGKYGIMNDGKVTCRPEFAHIQWLKGGKYYAVATYPYEVFRSKKTIISKKGQDLRVTLYGKVTPHGEVVEGETIAGKRTFWDGVGLQYYSYMPDFEEVGGVQMICKGGKYLPRQASRYQKEPVEKRDIWFNDYILWMDKVVIIKKTGKAYPIEAYGANCFYVRSLDYSKGSCLKVKFDGYIVGLTDFDIRREWGMNQEPEWTNEQLIRASSGKLEYLDKSFERIRKQIMVY